MIRDSARYSQKEDKSDGIHVRYSMRNGDQFIMAPEFTITALCQCAICSETIRLVGIEGLIFTGNGHGDKSDQAKQAGQTGEIGRAKFDA